MEGRVEILNNADYAGRMAEIEKSSQISPWSDSLIRECFAPNSRSNVLGYFDENCCLRGFLVYSVLLPESELENISVEPSVQDQGIGTSLMKSYCDILERLECEKSFLEVRVSNDRAIHLYSKFGYFRNGVRKKYYPCADGTREDAILMMLERSKK